jgi:aminoglycoside phosphotransferase (APT) family kinase protein
MGQITPEFLEAYLAEKWREGVKVEKLERFARGISRETWFIDIRRAGSAVESLILRRDLDGNSIGTATLRFEYEVYHRLQGSGVPVAEVLWWEEDPRWVADGRPFYLRRQVDGRWDVPNYGDRDPAYDNLRVEIGREHVRKLAIIHGCDWRALGFGDLLPAPADESQCAAVAIERAYDDLARFQFSPLPIIAEVREWLLDNAPRASRISLLKGTNGLGEEVFRDGVIVAMSDWEQASIGDPASDFARAQEFFQDVVIDGRRVWGLDEALDYYAEVSGVRIDSSSVQYYRVLTGVENTITLHHGAKPLAEGSSPSVRLSWLATEAIYGGHRRMMDAVTGRMQLTDRPRSASLVELKAS